MAYIGNTQLNQNYVPAIDYFSGNGSTTAFTLSRPVASVAQVQAVIENVPQNPGDAYTVSGNTITFTSAPPSGTNNIYIYYTSPNTQVVQPGQGTVGTIQMADGVTVNFNDGSAAAPSITNTGDTNTGMFFPAADTIAFSEGGVESMRIDSSGNVGIGTSSPTQKLDVNGTIKATAFQGNGSGLTGLSGGFSNMQIYTSGTGTWTIPSGVTACKITVVGGGGNGGGKTGASNISAFGGGGGAGGAAIRYYTGLTSGNTISYTVGAASGTSSVSSGTQTITSISATGGSAGPDTSVASISAGGAGGVGSGGNINIVGAGGGVGSAILSVPVGVGGTGGASIFGGGALGGRITSGTVANGSAATGYGAGGGGAACASPSTASGGAGAAGVVIIEY